MRRIRTACGGFTLLELAVVVLIIAVIAMLAVPKVNRVAENAKLVAAERDLKTLAEAFTDPECGYLRDMRGIPGFSVGFLRLGNLFVATNLYGAVAEGTLRTTSLRVDVENAYTGRGCARPETFVRWNMATERGWRGPYAKSAGGEFPYRNYRRFDGDGTAEERGFFPSIYRLRLPIDFIAGRDGCSVYGFPGEPVSNDPWGNPYVLQIPPPQAFGDIASVNTNLADEVRFAYARIVSAGPDGRLSTPCFSVNTTNDWRASGWSERECRSCRQAGRIDGEVNRGDDLVYFLFRNDTDEGRSER